MNAYFNSYCLWQKFKDLSRQRVLKTLTMCFVACLLSKFMQLSHNESGTRIILIYESKPFKSLEVLSTFLHRLWQTSTTSTLLEQMLWEEPYIIRLFLTQMTPLLNQ